MNRDGLALKGLADEGSVSLFRGMGRGVAEDGEKGGQACEEEER